MSIRFALPLLFFLQHPLHGEPLYLAKNSSGYTYFQQLTGDEADSDKNKWDKLYRKNKGYVYGTEPNSYLVQVLDKLPVGHALDLGMGEGQNAVFLAKKGFDVTGIDISKEAVFKAKRLARENKVQFKMISADLSSYKLAPEAYDVILLFYFWQKSLAPQIVKALKPGGVVVFENYTGTQSKYDKTTTRSMLSDPAELRAAFKELSIQSMKETDDKKSAYVQMLAKKPKS